MSISVDKNKALELIIDENTIVIDVRTPEELEEVPAISDECYNIPFDSSFLSTIEEEELDKDTNILLYCVHGVRSLKATLLLRDRGYINAFNLEGGIASIFEGIPFDDEE